MSDAASRDREPPDEPAGERAGEARVLAFPRQPSARPLRDVIGDVLREERLDQERTLGDVARRAAVSLPYLSEVERGRKDVSSDVLAAICDALDLPLADVLDRSARRLRPTSIHRSRTTLMAA